MSSTFTEVIGFDRFAVYVFDYDADRLPAGDAASGRITAIISQNGNAYEEFDEGWNPIRACWRTVCRQSQSVARLPRTGNDDAGSIHGVTDETAVSLTA